MARSPSGFLNEDTNQFGPGTDLVVALLAVLLVLTAVTSKLYTAEKAQNAVSDSVKVVVAHPGKKPTRQPETPPGGDFHLASEAFLAGEFKVRPVTELNDPASTRARVSRIVADYRAQAFQYVFVIGHSNRIDARDAEDVTDGARRQRNWEYAGRRAALIAAMIAEEMDPGELDRLVVMTTGEFDMRNPAEPMSQENAWVEVVFGKNWKPPSRMPPPLPRQ